MRHLNTLGTLGAAVAATIGFTAGPASAALITQTLTYGTSSLGILNPQSFNLFNTNVGTLTAVTLTFDGTASWNGSLTNTAASPSTGSYTIQTNFILMGGNVGSFTQLANNSFYASGGGAYTAGTPGLDAILRRNTNPGGTAVGFGRRDTATTTTFTSLPVLSTSGNFSQLATNGTININASDTISSDDAGNYSNAAISVALSAASDLNVFKFNGVSTDTITLNTLSYLQQTISGGSALQQSLTSSASGTLRIDYTFDAAPPPPASPPPVGTPEPASMAMLGMGLVGLGAAVRRRRRT